MSRHKRPRPTGTVGIVAQEISRYSEFYMCCTQLRLPPGWVWKSIYGYDLVHSRDKMAREFQGDYLLFLDDDHWLPPDLIHRLLAHNKKIVAPLCLKRYAPFQPTCYVADGEPLVWNGEADLREVYAVGCAGMMIHRDVFDAIGYPYFIGGQLYGNGDTAEPKLAEDVEFCQRARKAGFEIYVDLGLHLGHFTPTCVFPVEGGAGFYFGGGYLMKGPKFNELAEAKDE